MDDDQPQAGPGDGSPLGGPKGAGETTPVLADSLAADADAGNLGLDAASGEPPEPVRAPSVARSTATMSLSTMLSRVTGFVRLWAMALAIGATSFTSAYNIANTIPNMVYELVAGGILSSMFIPVFMELTAKNGEEDARDFASTILWLAMIGLGVVSLIGTIWPQPFVYTQMPRGTDPQTVASAVYLFRFFAIQMLIYGAGAVMTGILNSRRLFLAPAVGPVFNNVVVIATFFVYIPLARVNLPLAVTVLAIGTTLGVVAQIAPMVPSLLRSGFRFTAKLDLHHPALRRTGLLALPLLLYVATNLVGVTFRNRFALQVALPGLQPDAGQAIVTYAWVFYQLPYGIFAVALATAFFPELSAAAQQADWKSYADHFTRGLRTTALLILPCAALLVALAYPIVRVYKFGSFNAAGVAPTAQVLSVWALGLFSFAAFMFILRSFYSMQDTRTPMVLNIFATALQVAMYWAFTQGVGGWKGFGIAGIPASDVITYSLLSIALLIVLRRRIGPMGLGTTAGSVGRSVVVAVGAGLAAWAVVALTPVLGATKLGFLVQVAVGGSLGLAVAAGLAIALHIPEVAMARRLISRVVGRLLPGRG
jgi:putative peptidoglycan lipid II flippase